MDHITLCVCHCGCVRVRVRSCACACVLLVKRGPDQIDRLDSRPVRTVCGVTDLVSIRAGKLIETIADWVKTHVA